MPGTNSDDFLTLTPGDDDVVAMAGNDTIFGDISNSVFGNDSVDGGLGLDVLRISTIFSPVLITANGAQSLLSFGNSNASFGSISIANVEQIDLIAGSAIEVDASGSTINLNLLSGGPSSPIGFRIGYGNVIAGSGNDTLTGGRADLAPNRSTSQELSGGAGDDVFVFERQALSFVASALPLAGVIIMDLSLGDRIDLSRTTFDFVGSIPVFSNDPAINTLAPGEIGVAIVGDRTVLQLRHLTGIGGEVFSNVTINNGAFTLVESVPGSNILQIADTVSGSLENDSLQGTPEPDFIRAFAGDDTVLGFGAADTLNGQAGNDSLVGGAGDDSLVGDSGEDFIDGGNGNDELRGGTGADTLFGRDGNDRLTGGNLGDLLDGGDGNDLLQGLAGNDTAIGALGNDVILGFSGDDLLRGGSGDDQLGGGTGDDTLFGGPGDDRLTGAAGGDSLVGGTGNDRLTGLIENDTLIGDAGNDTLLGGTGDDQLTGGQGRDVFIFADDFGRDSITDLATTGISADLIDLSQVTAITDFADLLANHIQVFSTIDPGGGITTQLAIVVNEDRIFLDGISQGDLSADDFIF